VGPRGGGGAEGAVAGAEPARPRPPLAAALPPLFAPSNLQPHLPPTTPPPGEYIDDTEDYINIELDYSRNRLLRLEIMITVGGGGGWGGSGVGWFGGSRRRLAGSMHPRSAPAHPPTAVVPTTTQMHPQVATFCLALYNLLAGVLGENLVLPSAITQDIRGFILVNGTAVTVCVALFFTWWRMMVKRKMI
jgi:hypothetical protein